MNILRRKITPKITYPKRKTFGIEERIYLFDLKTRKKLRSSSQWHYIRSYKTEKNMKNALRDLRTNAYSRFNYTVNGSKRLMLCRYRPCRIEYIS